MTPHLSNGWTEERRRKQAQAIKNWEPWTRSTGPRPKAGKEKVSQNAYKHGMRSAWGKELFRVLAAQKRYVRGVMARLGK